MTQKISPHRVAAAALLGFFWSAAALPLSAAEAFPPLFPFLISYDGPDNASSMAHLLDAPAGKHGFVRVENGRFVNDAGPVRLHATNLTGPANFPTHEQADKLAARLARFGINCVRLHYFDAQYGNFMTEKETGIFGKGDALPGAFKADPNVPIPFAPEQVDRQDYLIAALKKRGIYVDINLHVARFPKTISFFEPRVIASEKEYARKLLTRVNPYTKLAYTDDPCVAVIEINNENALLNRDIAQPHEGEFRKQWNAWLRKKYATTAAMLDAWKWTSSPLHDEQIPEGKFNQPVAMDGKRWILAAGSAQASASADGGVMKIIVTREGHEFFPKLFRHLTVKKGQPYTLSFKIRCAKDTPDATLGLAVADTTRGWRPLGLHKTFQVGAVWRTICCAFIAAEDSDKAQLQLTRFSAGTYEFADVSFQSGAQSDLDATGRIEDGTVPTLKAISLVLPQAKRDFYQFLVDTERAYWTGIARYLKDELKARSVISGTQLGYSPPFVQAELDYIDAHAYWCHPHPVNPGWRIRNESMLNSLDCILGLAGQRVLGKPYTVSEYNHPFPNQYGAEGQPLLRAYGRLQGWDGVFEYTYNHSPDFEPDKNTYFFSILARTDVLAHFPACAAIFLRGDVQEAKSALVGDVDYPAFFDRLTASKAVGASIGSLGFDRRQALLHKTAVALSGKTGTDPATVEQIPEDQQIFVSDTGELTWNTEQAGAGYWTINTPNTKLFTGFPQGRTIALGGVTLTVGKTRLAWATVSLVSRNATGFGESGRPANILLAATGVAENKGMVITRVNAKEITSDEKWGAGPVCVEGVPATVTLPVATSRLKCFALDPHGNRKQELAVEQAEGGGARIVLKPEYATVWYELDVK
jgi:hypothetical protein